MASKIAELQAELEEAYARIEELEAYINSGQDLMGEDDDDDEDEK